MDRIAGEGVRFTRAYTTCPSCIAARRSLLSGQFPATHGMVGYCDGIEWDVFLAHASVDKPFARQLNALLTARGVSVCFDEEVLRPGDDWHALLPRYESSSTPRRPTYHPNRHHSWPQRSAKQAQYSEAAVLHTARNRRSTRKRPGMSPKSMTRPVWRLTLHAAEPRS
jgi:hypothetical protein